MDFGVHLPLMNWGSGVWSLRDLARYAESAALLGFKGIAVNDHLAFAPHQLDSTIALAAVLEHSGTMTLATTVALPVVRGPAALAKAMASLQHLSGGRFIAGVGAGGRRDDYAAVRIPFDQRWSRFDEAIQALRALLDPRLPPFRGRYYDTAGLNVGTHSFEATVPPVWIGSWGSQAGLRRVARHADGWFVSAYHTDPDRFAETLQRLEMHLTLDHKEVRNFPTAIVSMFTYITDDHVEADHLIHNVLSPRLGRDPQDLRSCLLIGPAEECARRLSAYRASHVQRVYLWPIRDEIVQLDAFRQRVAPLIVDPPPPTARCA